jgi:tRNA A37 N6-isopentenylltransferase MiaA
MIVSGKSNQVGTLKIKKMAQVKLNIDELKSFMGHMVKNNQHIQAQGKVPVAVNVEGEAGLGKTSSILQLAKELDMAIIKLNLSQIEELGDLVGFPFKEFQVENKENAKNYGYKRLFLIHISKVVLDQLVKAECLMLLLNGFKDKVKVVS